MGCSGWSYTAWVGHFYPKRLGAKDFLAYYSKVFDYVEINSSFYGQINPAMTRKWARNTPDHFRFTAKLGQDVTHEKRLGKDSEMDMKMFYEGMEPLGKKLACILVQLPPTLTKEEGFKKLKQLPFDPRFRHAIEARHVSWFDEEVYDYFRENSLCLAWSQLAKIQTPPVVTTDFIYLRFIGDRSIPDSEFGTLQKDRSGEMLYWVNEIDELDRSNVLKMGFVAANNHYAGFGPATANGFRRMVGLPEVKWDEMKQRRLD